jgi:hypothetical protein
MARIQTTTTHRKDSTIERELDWQARVEGDGYKSIAFRDLALGQQAFWAFAFMKGKLPMVHIAHLVGTFFVISGSATDMQGKHITFIGDHGNGCYPVPFILPPQNAWTWTKAKYLHNTAKFRKHYNDSDNQDKLWITGASKADLSGMVLPSLLALPTFVAEFLAKQS